MIDHFEQYMSDAQWLIFERGWNPQLQQVTEAQLALANGYIGSRAVLEEIPEGSCPGTFFAGIYDITGAQVTELVNAPNPINFKISIEGEKLGVKAMDVHSHERILDMKNGILARRTNYVNAKKERFNYQSLRFFSMHDKHIAAMQVYITPLDSKCVFTFQTNIDTSVTNKGLITEGKKKHFHIADFSKAKNDNYLCTQTLEKEILLAYAFGTKIKKGNKTYNASRRTFKISLKKGQTACITQYFSFYTSKEINSRLIKNHTLNTLKKAEKKGFDKLINEHKLVWEKKWRNADIQIEGDLESQRALRFNIYHLLASGSDKNLDTSIGAKLLTGEGYRGHFFWDTEIFIIPFYIFTNPEIAKNLLLYRYNRLEAARKNAKDRGYKGAMFPWESADTGEECTPSWYKSSTGSIERVNTGLQEHHITADIAYAAFQYFNVTNDFDYMLKYGLEIIFETARFWASRVEWNQNRHKYEIHSVIGPDEFHENIDNNAYTNMLAKWNLEIAAKLYKISKKNGSKRLGKIAKKINLKTKEINNWLNIASKIFIPYSKKNKLIEEFEGYFKLKKYPSPELNSHHMPIVPKGFNLEKLGQSQFIKQADVVMLLYVLSDMFDDKTKEENYDFYEKRCLHNSSLSASMHALMGVDIGDKNKSYKYFLTSLFADLRNIYKNTADGIHAASLGGTWQVAVNGFAGVKIIKGILSFNPRLPYNWQKMSLILKWREIDLSVQVTREHIALSFKDKKKNKYIFVRVYGILQKLYANKPAVFNRKKVVKKM